MVVYISFLIFIGIFAVDAEINSNQHKTNTLIQTSDKLKDFVQETVTIDFFYECLCPDCMQTYIDELQPTVSKLKQYLQVNTFPYGNAKTIIDNGDVTFQCQHGEMECYGNKLHACAIKHFPDKYIDFNKCIIEKYSNDKAAEDCGKTMGLDSEVIKKCAKSDEGTQYLKYYGDESAKAHFHYVPYILVNKIESQNLFQDVCAAFENPPDACKSLNVGIKQHRRN